MEKIRTVMVGLGRIASSLEEDPYRRKPCTHAGTLLHPSLKPKFQIAAVVDTDESKIQAFLARHEKSLPRKISQYTNLNQFQNQENCHFGIVATLSETHVPIACRLIELGIRNLLVEKPMALDYASAKKLHQTAKKAGARVWVNHERRYHPVYRFFWNRLMNGEYGRIWKIHASVLTSFSDPGHGFSKVGVGPLFHDGTHAIDYLQWLLGEPKKVHAKLTYPGKKSPRSSLRIEGRAVAWLEYPNEVEVFFEVGGYRKYFQFELDIQTETHRIVLSNDGFHFFESQPSKLYKGFRSLVEKKLPIPQSILVHSNPFLELYKSIYLSITQNLPVETGGIEDNLSIFRILHRIQKSCFEA